MRHLKYNWKNCWLGPGLPGCKPQLFNSKHGYNNCLEWCCEGQMIQPGKGFANSKGCPNRASVSLVIRSFPNRKNRNTAPHQLSEWMSFLSTCLQPHLHRVCVYRIWANWWSMEGSEGSGVASMCTGERADTGKQWPLWKRVHEKEASISSSPILGWGWGRDSIFWCGFFQTPNS